LTDAKLTIEHAEVALIPKNTVKLEGDQAKRCLDLMNMLDEHEDVKTVTANFDIDQSILDKVSG
jgi:transcriptional/translational regulatory protein YebC/TACO1